MERLGIFLFVVLFLGGWAVFLGAWAYALWTWWGALGLLVLAAFIVIAHRRGSGEYRPPRRR